MTSPDADARPSSGVPAPAVAERARSLAERSTPELACGEPLLGVANARVAPVLQHLTDAGQAVLVLPADDPISARAGTPARPVPAMLELTDRPQVPLAEPVRGLVWIIGWLHRLDGRAARDAAVEIAAARPDPVLLEVNHSMAVLRLAVGVVILADGEGTGAVGADEFAAAAPDPFCLVEAGWSHHLECHHPDVLARLAGHAPPPARPTGGRVRVLGLDRFGIRVRRNHAHGHTDARIPFTRPVSCSHELNTQLRALSGAPAGDEPLHGRSR